MAATYSLSIQLRFLLSFQSKSKIYQTRRDPFIVLLCWLLCVDAKRKKQSYEMVVNAAKQWWRLVKRLSAKTQKVKTFRSAEFHAEIIFATYMRQKCVNCFHDIYVPKVRKSLSRHTCQNAKTLFSKVRDMDVAKILQTIKYLSRKFPDCSESFQTVWKVSRQSGNFLHCQKTFNTVKKNSRLSENFPDQLKTFQIVWKLSRVSGEFPECPESFQTVWKVSRPSRYFPDCQETFHT